MTATLTASLRCHACAREWTHDAELATDSTRAVSQSLLGVYCPQCMSINPAVRTMRFCQAPKVEGQPG